MLFGRIMKFLANKSSSISRVYLTKARYASDENMYLNLCPHVQQFSSVTYLGQNDLSRAEGRIWLWVKWKRDEEILKYFRPSCYQNKLIKLFHSDLICISNIKKKSFIGWILSSLFNYRLIDGELVCLIHLNKVQSTMMMRWTLKVFYVQWSSLERTFY